MAIKEAVCRNPDCPTVGLRQEHFYHVSETNPKPCDSCGGPTEPVEFSRSNVIFSGAITARYNDRSATNPHQEGHWAWRKKTLNGKPEPVFIDSWSAQKDFCKAEGLTNPKDMPRNYEVGEDGKTLLNTRGMPGTEI